MTGLGPVHGGGTFVRCNNNSILLMAIATASLIWKISEKWGGAGWGEVAMSFHKPDFLAPVSPGEMGMDFSCKGLRDGKACTAELRKPRPCSHAG